MADLDKSPEIGSREAREVYQKAKKVSDEKLKKLEEAELKKLPKIEEFEAGE